MLMEGEKGRPLFLPAAICSVLPVSYCRSNVVKQKKACFLFVFVKGKTTDAILCKQCAMVKNLKEDPVKNKI